MASLYSPTDTSGEVIRLGPKNTEASPQLHRSTVIMALKEVDIYGKLAFSSLIGDLLMVSMPRFAIIFRGRQSPDA